MNGPQARSIIPVAVHQAHFVAGTLRRASGIPAIAAEAAIRPAAPLPARARRSQLVPCPAPSYKQNHESTRAGASRSSEARAYPIRAAPPAVNLASPVDSTPRSSTAIAHRGIFVSQPGWRSLSAVGAHDAPKKPSTIPVAVHQAHLVAGTLRRALGIPTIAAKAAIRPAAPLPARARRSQLVPCPAPSRKQSHESTRAGASRSSGACAYPIHAAPPAVHLASSADATPRSDVAVACRCIFVSQRGWRRCTSACRAHK